jgi:hypothetical protein
MIGEAYDLSLASPAKLGLPDQNERDKEGLSLSVKNSSLVLVEGRSGLLTAMSPSLRKGINFH